MDTITLTPRQHQVVELLAQGKTQKEIGEALGITIKTANAHTYAVHLRLGIGTSTGIVAWYYKRRIALLEAFIERNNLGKVIHR